MSVTLRPINNRKLVGANICNGHMRALTVMAEAFGEDVQPWNGCHDGQRITPEQLRAIAKRVEHIKDDAEWLRWLADRGGAIVT